MLLERYTVTLTNFLKPVDFKTERYFCVYCKYSSDHDISSIKFHENSFTFVEEQAIITCDDINQYFQQHSTKMFSLHSEIDNLNIQMERERSIVGDLNDTISDLKIELDKAQGNISNISTLKETLTSQYERTNETLKIQVMIDWMIDGLARRILTDNWFELLKKIMWTRITSRRIVEELNTQKEIKKTTKSQNYHTDTLTSGDLTKFLSLFFDYRKKTLSAKMKKLNS